MPGARAGHPACTPLRPPAPTAADKPILGFTSDAGWDEGDFFGELAIMGDSVRHAAIRAETDLETFSIRADALCPLFEGDPSMRTLSEAAQASHVERAGNRGGSSSERKD